MSRSTPHPTPTFDKKINVGLARPTSFPRDQTPAKITTSELSAGKTVDQTSTILGNQVGYMFTRPRWCSSSWFFCYCNERDGPDWYALPALEMRKCGEAQPLFCMLDQSGEGRHSLNHR